MPRRSQRGRRGVAVRWVVALSVGLLVLALSGSARRQILSPGPLTLHHGLLGCGACHSVFAAGPAGWLHTALAPTETAAGNKPCLACHDLGTHAAEPHSLPASVLAESRARLRAASDAGPTPIALRAAAWFAAPAVPQGDLACATCHQEHRGHAFDQTAMDNGRCQSCHSVKFHALANGHPSFGSYPFTRRTRIVFDHNSHRLQHFAKANKPDLTCNDCHFADPTGELMLVADFETACGACHSEEIVAGPATGPKGLAVLAVPGLDLPTLGERGAAIGAWPEWSEEPVTPFMRALLSTDDEARADLERLDHLDLLDLRQVSDEDIAAVERVAWRIKELLDGMVTEGPAVARAALASSLGAPPEDLPQRLAAMPPFDVVRAAEEAWFPDLQREVAAHRRGERVPLPGAAEQGAADEPSLAVGPEVSGRPAEAGSAAEDADILGAPETPSDEDILNGAQTPTEDQDILDGAQTPSDEDILGDEGTATEDQDILNEAPIPSDEDILSSEAPPAEDQDILGGAPAAPDEDILGGEAPPEEDQDILGGEEPAPEQTGAAAETEAASPERTPVSQEAWSALGGWYRDEFALRYRPAGHADPFVRGWLDLGAAVSAWQSRLGEPLRATLTANNAPGKCGKCHSVDRSAGGGFQVNWRARQAQPEVRQFTRFSHASHFSLLDEKGCLTCHAFAAGGEAYLKSFEGTDPGVFTANFKSPEVSTCASCHVADLAGDACLLCHRYHVGHFAAPRIATQMAGEPPQE